MKHTLREYHTSEKLEEMAKCAACLHKINLFENQTKNTENNSTNIHALIPQN